MATMTNGLYRTFKAGADLVTHQYKIVKADANGDVVLATAATDILLGTLDNKPLTKENAVVAMRHGGGTHKVKLGGTVARGDRITSNASGLGIATTTATHQVIGIALEAGVSGDVIEYSPSTEVI